MKEECKKCFNQVCKGVRSSGCKHSSNFSCRPGESAQDIKTKNSLMETDIALGYNSKWNECIGSDETFGCYRCQYYQNGEFDNCPVYKG